MENGQNETSGAAGDAIRVAILYRRNTEPDDEVVALLEQALAEKGFSVFIDRKIEVGVEWAKEIEEQIRLADAVVPIVSETSMHSEMLGFEVEHAHETAQQRHGRPALLPVRVNYTGPLTEPMAGILDPVQYILWEGGEANEGLVTELVYALQRLPDAASPEVVTPAKGERLTPKLAARINRIKEELSPTISTLPRALETVGGAVPLESEFYLVRPVDEQLQAALDQRDSMVLIKGARQMGKTSLLARGLEYGRKQGCHVAFNDLQKLSATNLHSANTFYLTLSESLADQLELEVLPSEIWDERRGANANFERYMRREVLQKLEGPLIWGLDEVDRLFGVDYGSDVFGLFRSWHNERALDPTGPWANLTLTIAYATEAHLFITDMNQSPFNVGTRLTVEDLTPLQVAEMNRRYHSPLKHSDEVNRLVRLVGGHPYLVRRALHELATNSKLDFDRFEEEADRDEGVFGDHLRRILVLLARDPELTNVVRGVLGGVPCPTPESFYRLRSAGVMHGNSQSEARPRCRLYSLYLKRHLLSAN